ncbi:MAG: flagella basal body P-ring formation protein FlgA [Bdellovibrionales bacterium RIFOXYD1_FULL_53_11]|nr:MAG: flagella basal body P-ring formation protein FlgA [Bdellovibrionales bacterium RIFOXYD1_FULL_53_11]
MRTSEKKRTWAVLAMFFALFASVAALAAVDNRKDATDRLDSLIQSALAKNYPGARIEITGAVRWIEGSLPADPAQVRILGDIGRGEARFSVQGEEEVIGDVRFAAWMPAQVAVRRVMPGERLAPEMFSLQDVNVAAGMAREYRGVILKKEAELSRLEARQTILEGSFAMTAAVQKIPDVRRGDQVRVRLVSGSISLITMGTAAEPAYVAGRVRVIAGKIKKELTGRLSAPGVVEVQL